MRDLRLRHQIKLSLFSAMLSSLGVAPAIWMAHKVFTSSPSRETGLIVCSVSLANAFFFFLGRRLFPFAPRLNSRLTPPLNAEFLFYLFLTPANCDALVGDLEERYKLIHKKFGRRRANFWYWTQAIQSVGPIVWAWAKNVSLKPVVAVVGWAVGKGLLGHDGWLATLVELWKKVRS